ncbi:MAG TPA: helix-turn-helix domain-containing protein [Tissierellaceae bacterium]
MLINEVVNSKSLIIKQVQNSIDGKINSLEELTFQLSLQPQIKAAAYYPRESNWSSYQNIFYEAINTIRGFRMSNDLVSGIWVYLLKSNAIVNDMYKYNKDFFFKNVFKCDGINWNEVIKRHPNFIFIGKRLVVIDSTLQTVLLFSRAIPIDSFVPQGLILIAVSESVFSEVLGSINEKVSSLFIIDSEGDVILSSRGGDNTLNNELVKEVKELTYKEGYFEKVIEGKDYVVIFTTSEITDWKYVTVIPTQAIIEEVGSIKQITVIVAILSLLIGIAFSYKLTVNMYYPINEIMNYINTVKLRYKINGEEASKRKLFKNKPSENELSFISKIIRYIWNENENLKNLFKQNVHIVKEKLIYELLDGNFSKGEFIETCYKIGIKFPYTYFQVIVFEIDSNSFYNNQISIAEIKETIHQIYIEKYNCNRMIPYYIVKEKNKIVMLINAENELDFSMFVWEFVQEVKQYFNKSLHEIEFTVGIGGVYSSLEEVCMSLSDALTALKHKIVRGIGSIIHIEEVKSIPSNCILDYPIEIEKQIINFIKTGKMKETTYLLDQVIQRNIQDNKTSLEVVDGLFNMLAGTAIRTIYEIRSSISEIFGGYRNIYKELLEKNTLEEKKRLILEIFQDIGCYIYKEKKSWNDKIITKVKEYIHNNYYKYDLSLSEVSEKVGLSPSYLSSIFKSISGYNFVDYVNMIRIEKSKDLLKHSNLKIKEISQKVGFYSPNTYIKVFKKKEGITPGQFRKIIK